MGPDTYLLQLRDTDFPARLRRYMNVAASRSPTFALKLRQDPWLENVCVPPSPSVCSRVIVPFPRTDCSLRQVAVRERRRFTDVMDEEIEDEKRQPTYNDGYSVPRRVRHEIGTATDIQKQADAYMDTKREGSVSNSFFIYIFSQRGTLPLRDGGRGCVCHLRGSNFFCSNISTTQNSCTQQQLFSSHPLLAMETVATIGCKRRRIRKKFSLCFRQVPFFREKLQLNALVEDEPAQLTCFAVGVPKPVVQWFR